MAVISMSNRCTVIAEEDSIIKSYCNPTSFYNEKNILTELQEESFVPRIIFIPDNNEMWIRMEKLNGIRLDNWKQKLPQTFVDDMLYIEKAMAMHGIFDRADRYKLEHIFMCDEKESPQTHGVRIIDFDVDSIFPKDNSNFVRLRDQHLDYIESNYEKQIREEIQRAGLSIS